MRFLVNGIEGQVLPAADRGLAYGDGVFRTFRIVGRRPLHWELHYRRLVSDCEALRLPAPPADVLERELSRLMGTGSSAVGKIIVTRGSGERGYDPAGCEAPTRLVGVGPLPSWPASHRSAGVRLRVCGLRVAAQPRLAGIKHLNRLENVLARAEWTSPDIAEGLMLDQQERVVEGTMSNLFLVSDGELVTPDLSRSGVAGVQRGRIVEAAPRLGYPVRIAEVRIADVLACDEAFLVNSVIGLWPVRELEGRAWKAGPVTRRIAAELFHEMA